VDLHLDQDHQPAAMGLGVARPLGKALVGKCTIYLYLYVYIYIDVCIYISIDVYVYIYIDVYVYKWMTIQCHFFLNGIAMECNGLVLVRWLSRSMLLKKLWTNQLDLSSYVHGYLRFGMVSSQQNRYFSHCVLG